MEKKLSCECHLIDWSRENGNYIHISSGNIYDSQKHGFLDCQTKLKEGIINYGEYFNLCKYIPGDPKSHFPSFLEKKKNETKKIETQIIEEGIPPIPDKIFK